ncbi:hypothetical protein MAM1_0365d10062 [Mucor ambiguus]|uniref:Uncharacterized protein n=1 Tax=Mucor ambiguus TaxID=91626 RepID=A0A0C9MI73_9FUNG|nr:hypothetical protein MAM1_0365d10062 [Mucor ambiguus]
MFSLKQKWKALGQTAINSVNRDTANSASVSNASTQSSLEQTLSINQRPSSEVFDMEFEAKDGDAEQSGNPTNDPTSSSPSTTEHSTARQPPTKPIDIKYFVPKNIEPEGLSQSVMISDYDYIHRQLVKRYKMSKATGSTSQRTPLHQETVQESSNEELDYMSTDDEYNEEDSLSGNAAIANRLFSQSVPLLSSMSDYPRFAWSAITPPDHEYKTKNNTCSPLLHIKEGHYSSETEFKTNKNELEVSLDQDLDANVEQQAVSTDDEDLKEWMEAANECYGEVSEAEKKLFESRLCAVNLETPWDRAHRNENAIEKLKKNEFIHLLFKRYSVPMKVTNVAENVRFKQIQYHLHNPNILVK